jgi:hypothetical protein
MLYGIMLSLRRHLSEEVPEINKAVILYDGINLTGIDQPFVSLEETPSLSDKLSATRGSYRETYNLQLGIFANDYEERLKLQSKVKDAILDVDITYYDENFEDTGQTFTCEVTTFTPISSDDLADETNKFRGYYDISIELLREGANVFNQ